MHSRRMRVMSCSRCAATLGLGGGNFKLPGLVRQAQQVGAGRDSGDEVLARLGGVGLELGFVNGFPECDSCFYGLN